MQSQQTQSTPSGDKEYAENTRGWQKHATVFFGTGNNVTLTYLLPIFVAIRVLCVASSATSAFLSYRTWLNCYENLLRVEPMRGVADCHSLCVTPSA